MEVVNFWPLAYELFATEITITSLQDEQKPPYQYKYDSSSTIICQLKFDSWY